MSGNQAIISWASGWGAGLRRGAKNLLAAFGIGGGLGGEASLTPSATLAARWPRGSFASFLRHALLGLPGGPRRTR